MNPLVRFAPVAATVVLDDCDEVLMVRRHRFATDTWNGEIPSGMVEDGESLETAAARAVEEETGWRVAAVAPLACVPRTARLTRTPHRGPRTPARFPARWHRW
ncbi:NUDIX hydrolase [Kitasatospora sp. NPDC049285]|uniref:NUDIX hydrolase n=1 Tax=Kitasatospora sp. NPDC049285 TaxID=3157096 RepID=UPI0034324D0A